MADYSNRDNSLLVARDENLLSEDRLKESLGLFAEPAGAEVLVECFREYADLTCVYYVQRKAGGLPTDLFLYAPPRDFDGALLTLCLHFFPHPDGDSRGRTDLCIGHPSVEYVQERDSVNRALWLSAEATNKSRQNELQLNNVDVSSLGETFFSPSGQWLLGDVLPSIVKFCTRVAL